MADNTQINEFFDLAAFAEQAQIVVDESAKAAEKMRANFAHVSMNLNADELNKYAAAVKTIQKAQEQARQTLSDYEKAQRKLTKTQGDYNKDLQQLEQLLQAEAQSTAAMAAQNKALEQIRKNLNVTDAKYAETVQKIIDKQNENIKKIKEFQNVEQARTSNIGKYREAIEAALNSTGGYRQQLANLRNTMAEVEQAIMEAKDAHGAESEEVRGLQEEYDKLQRKAGELQDRQNDMQARIRFLADDYGKFKAVLQGVQAALGIVSVIQGATAALGIHSKAVEKTTKNLAALITMMQGLKQVQELLNKDNYFRQLIKLSPALDAATTKISVAFKKMLGTLKSVGAYLGALSGIWLGFIKTLKAIRSNDFYEFNKTLDSTKDASERLALSQEFLQKQFGNTELHLGNLNERLKGTAKGFNDIVKAIAETALADAMATKLKEVVNKALDLAQYEAKANKELSKLRKNLSEAKEEAERQSRQTTSSNVLGLAGGGASYIGTQTNVDFAEVNKINDKISAINKALSEQQGAFKKLVGEYKGIVATSSADLSEALSDLLQGIDLSGMAKESGTIQTSASQTAKATADVAATIQTLGTAVGNLAGSGQLKALALSRNFTKSVADLQKQFLSGKITIEEYKERLGEITFRSQQQELVEAIKALREQNETIEVNTEEWTKNELEISKLEKQLNDLNFAKFSEHIKEQGKNTKTFFEKQFDLVLEAAKRGQANLVEITEATKKTVETIGDVTARVISNIESVSDTVFSTESARLAREETELAAHYELQRAYIEANITDETERQQALAELSLEEANVKIETARKEAEVERRKAKVELAITTAKATADVAEAIAAATLSAAPGDPYTVAIRIAAAVAAAVAAGVSVAAAAAKINSIPAFASGGEVKSGTIFRAGEKGFEVGEGASGKSYIFRKDGVYIAPEKMTIHKHSDSVQMVNNYNKDVTLRNSLTVKVIDNKRIEKYFNL